MSNLIKSGFIAFSQDQALVIDANDNKIIKGIDEAIQEAAVAEEPSMEDTLAEAMIEDAQLGESGDEDSFGMLEVSGGTSGRQREDAEQIIAQAKN